MGQLDQLNYIFSVFSMGWLGLGLLFSIRVRVRVSVRVALGLGLASGLVLWGSVLGLVLWFRVSFYVY